MATKQNNSTYEIGIATTIIIGFWLGLLPLGQRIFGAKQESLYGFLTSNLAISDPFTYIIPAIIMVVMAIITINLYKRKNQTNQ